MVGTRKESVNARAARCSAGLALLQSSTLRAQRRLPLGRPKIGPFGGRNGDDVSVVVYVLLTAAIFALLGTVLKLVERL
ncbi:MAG: hypothetical protein J2P17_02805 [Mycobacterium sp.]|nr:hypothetical protein [Mycobacterium sp.]